MRTKPLTAFLAFLLVWLSTSALSQQTYPTRPIRIIYPFAAGSSADGMTRLIAQEFQRMFGQPVIVENKTGAGGNIAADLVAKSAPDGYTLLLATNGLMMSSHLQATTFDPIKDFAPIGMNAGLEVLYVVGKNVPIKTIGELIAYAKANPDRLNYGTPGIGSPQHLSVELFKNMTGTRLNHVPYKGFSVGLPDLIAGRIDLMPSTIPGVLAHLKDGSLRALAIASPQRHPTMPGVPTIAETVPGFETRFWYGLVAPAGTPDAIVNKLSSAQRDVLAMPEVRERLVGFDIRTTDPKEMRRIMEIDFAKWGKIVKAAGIKAE